MSPSKGKSDAAGYSGTPLPKKLGVREGSKVVLLGALRTFEGVLGPLPPGARVVRRASMDAHLVVLFVKSGADLERRVPGVIAAMPEGSNLWIAWPKKSSGVATDLTEDGIRRAVLARGWVDFKVCAMDETWSGLRFARRKWAG